MTRSSAYIVIAACFGAALAGNAVAQTAAKVSFESLDKNSDGKISLNEAADHDAVFVAFKSLDTNKDGLLTPEEFAAYQKAGA